MIRENKYELTDEEVRHEIMARYRAESLVAETEEQKRLAEEREKAFDERRAKRIEKLRAEGFDV